MSKGSDKLRSPESMMILRLLEIASLIHEQASFSLAVPGPSVGPGFFFLRRDRSNVSEIGGTTLSVADAKDCTGRPDLTINPSGRSARLPPKGQVRAWERQDVGHPWSDLMLRRKSGFRPRPSRGRVLASRGWIGGNCRPRGSGLHLEASWLPGRKPPRSADPRRSLTLSPQSEPS